VGIKQNGTQIRELIQMRDYGHEILAGEEINEICITVYWLNHVMTSVAFFSIETTDMISEMILHLVFTLGVTLGPGIGV
jgi:hypothetical protein